MSNVLRVSSIAIVWDLFKEDFSVGVRHEVLGYTCMILAVVLIWSSDSLLTFLLDPVPAIRPKGPAGEFRHPLTGLWNWCFYVHKFDDSIAGVPSKYVARPQGKESKSLTRFGGVVLFVAIVLQLLR